MTEEKKKEHVHDWIPTSYGYVSKNMYFYGSKNDGFFVVRFGCADEAEECEEELVACVEEHEI